MSKKIKECDFFIDCIAWLNQIQHNGMIGMRACHKIEENNKSIKKQWKWNQFSKL